MLMMCDEAKQRMSGCQNFVKWHGFMKNDGIMSNGQPRYIREKVTKFEPQ